MLWRSWELKKGKFHYLLRKAKRPTQTHINKVLYYELVPSQGTLEVALCQGVEFQDDHGERHRTTILLLQQEHKARQTGLRLKASGCSPQSPELPSRVLPLLQVHLGGNWRPWNTSGDLSICWSPAHLCSQQKLMRHMLIPLKVRREAVGE